MPKQAGQFQKPSDNTGWINGSDNLHTVPKVRHHTPQQDSVIVFPGSSPSL